MRRLLYPLVLLALTLGGCVRFADVVWRLAPGDSPEADLAQAEAVLSAAGYKLDNPDAAPCRSSLAAKPCKTAFWFPYYGYMEVQLRYPLEDGGMELRYVEIPDGKFHADGIRLIQDLSERLMQAYGTRVRLVHPDKLPG